MSGRDSTSGEQGSLLLEREGSGIGKKLYNALSTPGAIPSYFSEHFRAVRRARTNGGVREAAFYLPELFGIGTYWPYLRRHSKDGLVRRPVQGHEMWLPIEDTGLSRELIWRGVHEPKSTALYSRLLRRLSERTDGVTVLEVGTNIGYFALLALGALPNDARIHGVEPIHRNVELLDRNLELNGYRDRVEVDELALSDHNGTDRLYVSEDTNCSRLGTPPRKYHGESTEVEVRTGDSFLRERGIPSGEVNVVRMDIQGHEVAVLEGMPEILAGDDPLLLFAELHDEVRDAGQIGTFVETLERNGLTLHSGFAEAYFRSGPSVEELDDLYEFPFDKWSSVQLFLQRGL